MSNRNWFQEIFGSAREALVERGWFGQAERRDPHVSEERSDDTHRDAGWSVLDLLGPEHFAPTPETSREQGHDIDR